MENNNIEIIEYNVQEIENYMDIINEIKVRIAIDKNGLTDELRELFQECKNEIITLRTNIEDLQKENLEIFEDNCIMARQIYVNERLQDFTSNAKKEKIKWLLLQTDEDMKYMDLEQIDNIFDVVLGEKVDNG